MEKLATKSYDILDFLVNDQVDQVANIALGLSKEAQAAVIPDAEEVANREESDFALILHDPNQGEMRKFAKYTPELVELNINILSNQADELPDEILKVAGANLGRAALDYGLDVPENLTDYAGESFINNHVDLTDIQKTASYSKKSPLEESPNGPFALPEIGKYPIRDTTEIRKAAEYFDKHHHIFDMDEKIEYAENTVKQASELDEDLSGRLIYKYGQLSSEKLNEDFEDHIRVRQSYLPDNTSNRGVYDEVLEKSAELSVEQTMRALSEVDKKTGLWSSWGKGVADPLMATYGIDKGAGMKIDGQLVTQADLEEIPEGYLTEKVGTTVVGELQGPEGPAVLRSLPRPIRREIMDEWIG